jgi:hypothetical protein
MGFDSLLKEGENAIDGQTSANQQAASGAAGGHASMEDTAVDSGKAIISKPPFPVFLSTQCKKKNANVLRSCSRR